MRKRKVTAEELLHALVRSISEMQCYVTIGDERIEAISATKEFQMHGLKEWCEQLGRKFKRVDWDGNKHCKTNHDMIYFDYSGCRFFELVSKEGEKK